MYRKILGFIISLIIFSSAAVLREFLVGKGMLDAAQLEKLAQCVQGREVTLEEAVAAFCRRLVYDGPY